MFPIPKTCDFPAIIAEALILCPYTKEGKKFRRNGIAFVQKKIINQYKLFCKDRNAVKMAQYADVVTVAFTDFVAHNTPTTISRDLLFGKEIVVANLAYLSLHTTDSELRQKFSHLLATI